MSLSNIAWGRWAFVSTLIVGSGYAIMKITSPTEKQLYDSLSPELRRKADAIRAVHQKNELQQRAEEASRGGSQGPVWADPKGGKVV